MIICKINMLGPSHTVFLSEEDQRQVSTQDLAQTIVNLCKETEDFHVHLFGVCEYAEYYADLIKNEERLIFDNSSIITVDIN